MTKDTQKPMTADTARPQHPVTRLLIISVITIVLTLAAAEGIVRAVPLYPDTFYRYDPQRGWVGIPNQQGVYLSIGCLGEYRQPITLNSAGIHDVEHDLTDQESRRVLVIGDSLVAGFEVPLESTFFRQASAILNERGSYQVISGGHQGYGTGLELMYYEQVGHAYAPDIVILVVEPSNDILDNNPTLRFAASTYYPFFDFDANGELLYHEGDPQADDPERDNVNGLHDVLFGNSRLYRLIYERNRMLRGVLDMNAAATQGNQNERSLQLTAALITRFRDTVQADGARFGVIIAPLNTTRPDASLASWQWLEALMTDEAIPFRSARTAFAPITDQSLFYNCDKYHWTQAGHTVMAGVLVDLVQALER